MTNKEIWEKAKNAIIGWCNENKIPLKDVHENIFPSYSIEDYGVIILSLVCTDSEYPRARFVIGTADGGECYNCFSGLSSCRGDGWSLAHRCCRSSP